MIAALALDKNQVVCVTGEQGRDGLYTTVAETGISFAGFIRNRPLSQSGLKDAIIQAVQAVAGDDLRRLTKIIIGVPGRYTSLELYREGEDRPQKDRPVQSLHRFAPGENRTSDAVSVEILADREFCGEIHAALADFQVEEFSFVSQNLAEGLFIIPKNHPDDIAIILNMGYYETNVCVYVKETQVYQATFLVGGAHVTRDLAAVLEIDVPQAEQIRRQFVFGIEYLPDAVDYARSEDGRLFGFDHRLVDDIVTARMDEWVRMVEGTRAALQHFTQGNAICYFLGSGVDDMRGIREYISSRLSLPFANLPLHLVDGSSRYSLAAMAVLDYGMMQEPSRGNLIRDRVTGLINRFRKK